jgi:hypothetical protein
VDHVEIAARRELYEALWKRHAGDELTLTIQRGEDMREVRLAGIDRAEFYR